MLQPHKQAFTPVWCLFIAHHQLFDEDGSLVAALTTWAMSKNIEIVVEAGLDGRPVHCVEIRERMHVSVHDWTEVTGAAIRSALRAPHWSEDKTLTDDERAERERMEAGHA